MENVKETITDIVNTRTQQSASRKDEIRVMQAMMNDRDFKVKVFDNPEDPQYYCPAEELRASLSEQIHKTTKMTLQEARILADQYEYSRSDAITQIGVAKEFINTYMDTGRKLPLGSRENSNVSLLQKKVSEGVRTYPKKDGTNGDGSDKYVKATTHVRAHNSIKIISTCPTY